MQDGSPSPIVCTRLAQWSEHGQKLLENESSTAALQQKITKGFLGLESEERNRDAKAVTISGCDQSWPASEGFGEGEEGLL